MGHEDEGSELHGRLTGPVSNVSDVSPHDDRIARFDPADPAFIADPYPVLDRAARGHADLLERATPTSGCSPGSTTLPPRCATADSGRAYTHRFTHAELGNDRNPTRGGHRSTSTRSGRCSPSNHPITPDSAGSSRRSSHRERSPSLGDAIAGFAGGAARPLRRTGHVRSAGRLRTALLRRGDLFDARRTGRAMPRLLLDWSHAIVKMYELDADDATKVGGRPRGRRVHRLHPVADRGEASASGRPARVPARPRRRRGRHA